MGLPREFMLTDVRCFEGEQRARLRPITLLVGENSTGKTTFLGCYSVLHRLFSSSLFRSQEPDFNQEPFSMGSFRDIVRARRGPKGLIHEFGIGLQVAVEKNKNTAPYTTRFTFSEDKAQPIVSNIYYEFDHSKFLELLPNDNDRLGVRTLAGSSTVGGVKSTWKDALYNLEDLITYSEPEDIAINQELWKILEHLLHIDMSLIPTFPNTISLAPLRSKPKRTYDPVKEVDSPEGDHVPMMMMRLNRTDEKRWQPLHKRLSTFGHDSGMFSDIQVRRHGKQMNDPFQLQVKARSGTPANIMDVGYGISQSLPILVDIYRHRDSLFLLQQPEVHLHPRAQAELATVFAESVRGNGNSFMIETHSDHIVDRMRILVRRGKIPAEDVSILYFEPVKNAVQIHNIEVNSDGNLENVPPGYRDFFLRESDRLLGFED